ncbi:MAG TPA: PAS domain S-box protein [Candidatus Limnocylindrales bacterium]|nr:PAS domain S-box protein [Candidatus Limnocylindrales bacterium]
MTVSLEGLDQYAVGIAAALAFLQLAAAYVAFRLGRLVGYKRLWIGAATGLLLLACYSALETWQLLHVPTLAQREGLEMIVALIGTAALALGLAAMEGPLRRTQAQQAQMREHQARLNLLIDQLPGQVWTTDAEGRMTFIRGRGLQKMGMSPQELEGRSIFDIFAPAGLAEAARTSHEAAIGGETVPFVMRYGQHSWEGALAPVLDDAGCPVGVVGVSIDVTAREEAAAAAAANEERLNAILDNAPALVFIKDTEDRILHFNRRCEELFGVSREHAVGQRITDLVPGDFNDAFVENDRKVLEQGVPMTFVETAERDGVTMSFLSIKFPLRRSDGTIYGICGIATDISERIEMEQELRRNQALLDEAQQMARLGNWEWDVVSGRRYWSPELYRLLGYEPDSGPPPTFESYTEHVPEEDRATLMQKASRAHLHGRPYSVEHRMRRADGRMLWVLAKGRLERDADGTPLRMYGFIQDITESKSAAEEIAALNTRLEDRVRQRTMQLEDALKQLGSFTYAVSHDLRQPLRAIAGRLSLLREDEAERLSPQAREHVERVQQAALRMDALIADLLSLSRVSYGALRREPLDVSDMARDVVAELTATEPERKVEWHIEDGMRAVADRGLVRIVLQNLIGNAFKFTRRCDVAHIAVCREKVDGETAFVVRDDGVGFDEAHAAHLFEPFQRLHESTEFEGTGVGLATVARIVGRHGGWIRASGTPGKGATLRFTLPDSADSVPALDIPSA